MCSIKNYLGSEICSASGSAAQHFLDENGIFYAHELWALESISSKERYKLDSSDNTHELIA